MAHIFDQCPATSREGGTDIRRSPLRAGSRRSAGGSHGSVPRGRRGRNGGTIVETAMVLGVCLLFLLGLMDFSRVFMIQQLVINAAREGCRYAIVSTSTVSTSQIQTFVTNYLCGQHINSLVINIYEADPTTGANLGAWTNAGNSNSIGVQITGSINTIVPKFSMLSGSMPVQATCVMASEGN